jgi:hypothetical protein
VPAELRANRMQWLIRLRYTLLCVCYVEAWYAPICLVTLPSAYALPPFLNRTYNVAVDWQTCKQYS